MRILFAYSLFLPAVAWAQQPQSPNECRSAAERVAKAPHRSDTVRAFARLQYCGTVGRDALVAGMREVARTRDRGRTVHFMSNLDQWRDAVIAEEAMRIAGDASSSVSARVYAIRHLISVIRPQYFITYDVLVAEADSVLTGDASYAVPCQGGTVSHTSGVSVTPPTRALESRIRAALVRIASSASSPRQVRNAAGCGDAIP